MNNPRDFLPAKYRNDQHSGDIVGNGTNTQSSVSTNTINSVSSATQDKPLIIKRKNGLKIAGILVILFLVVGIVASYMLSQENQDNRQQASEPTCDPLDPYCQNGRCISGYMPEGETCVPISVSGTDCGEGMHHVSNGDPNRCYNETCRNTPDGGIICGFITDDDPCTQDSMGGDWCDNPNTTHVETCAEAGLIRCQCSAGAGGGWWVIGSADSCGDLCDDANANCSDCTTTIDDGCEGNDCNPTDTPTGTPTEPPQKMICGETGCSQNIDCESGLTCQTINNNGSTTKICARGENQLFCAANPTTENCCTSQAIPVCASIEMLDSTNTAMTAEDDAKLKSGDEVRFRCSATGNQDIAFDYQFRVWAPDTNFWTNITDTSGTVAKNVSDSYVITNPGHYVAQGRICVGTECQAWELVTGSPATTSANPN